MLKRALADCRTVFILLAALIVLFILWESLIVSELINGEDGNIFLNMQNSKNTFSASYTNLFRLADNPFKVDEIFEELQDELVQKKIDENKSPITESKNSTPQVSSDPNAIQTVNNIKILTLPKTGEVYSKMNMGKGTKNISGIIASKDSFPLEFGMDTALISKYADGHIGKTVRKLNALYPDNNCDDGKRRLGELAQYKVNGVSYYAVAVSVDFAKAGDVVKCYTTSKTVPYILAFVCDLKSNKHESYELIPNRQLQGEIGHAYLLGTNIIQVGSVEFFISSQQDIGKNSAQYFKYGEFMKESNMRFTKLEIVGKLK